MRYITYDEYTSIGGVLDLTAFNRNADRAFGTVDNATHNRVENMSTVPDKVKALCRDLVEYFAGNFGSSRQISNHSQSAGGVSESESYVIRSTDERDDEIDDMVKDYLLNETDDFGTLLLYRGCIR